MPLLDVKPQCIPDELRAIDSWCVWKAREERKKDGTLSIKKEPRNGKGKLYNWKDQAKHLSFREAYDLYLHSPIGFDGVGFVLTGENGILGIDIDQEGNGRTLCDVTYVELSPSRKGMRAFGYVEGVDISKHPKGFGFFTKDRFLTVTGHQLSAVRHLGDCSRTLAGLLESVSDTKSSVSLTTLPKDKLSALLHENWRFKQLWTFEKEKDYDSFSEMDAAIAWQAVKSGWSNAEVGALLTEFRSRGRAHGFSTKGKEDRPDYIETTVKNVSAQVEKEVEEIPFLTWEQAIALPPMEWLVDGVVPEKSIGMLWGRWSTGKTFIMLDLAARMLCNLAWFDDREIKGGDVLYVLSEGEGNLPDRLNAWTRMHRRATRKHDIAIWTHAPQLTNASDCNDIRMFLKRRLKRCKLVVIDTLSRSIAGQDENSNQVMSQVVDRITLLARRTGASIVLVHHGTKPGEGFASVSRGGGALQGACDYSIESRPVFPAGSVRRPVPLKNIFELYPDKNPRGGSPFEPFPVFLRRSGDGVVVDTHPVLTDWIRHRRKYLHGISADQFVLLLELRKANNGVAYSAATIEKKMQEQDMPMSRSLIMRVSEELFPSNRPDVKVV